ncbi:MAG: aldolase catalytic domain-containing protein [Bacteroidales bacterium]|nr:aldolase catalytic domain-containing protein [Bacteroidales bacterium]
MSITKLLDCTLRDGGYINDFHFGVYGLKKIIYQLTEAGIDIVECGFLEDGEYDESCSVFQTVEQIKPFIPSDRGKTMYVAMACYGEYSIEQLSEYDGSSIDAIRVSFHYNEIEEALSFCKQVKQKGYKLFVQPIGTSSYSDEQLIELIQSVNKLQPFAFYLVDTLGLMYQDDVLRFYHLIDKHLDSKIQIGFHSHNNLQLSYSNGQALANLNSDRIISLDCSVNGMGRGAGNLNTELIANFLNEHQGKRYEIEPILEIVDEFIIKIREKFKWGYSVPYYLAAINGCHPNYATYFSDKQTLNVKSIATILRMIEPKKRSLFDKQLAEEKYREFQSREVDDNSTIKLLQKEFSNKNILLIAPGNSINRHQEEIINIAKSQNCIVLSVAFVPDFIVSHFSFISNLKRYNSSFSITQSIKLIHTSNIQVDQADKYVVNYSSLLNESDIIMDNAALMSLNLLTKLQPAKVYLAGMDGYIFGKDNYIQDNLRNEQDKERFDALNTAIKERISELKEKINLEFITPSLYNETL